jgi:hypothetical protein
MWLPTLAYLPVLSDWQWSQVKASEVSWEFVVPYVGFSVACGAVAFLFMILFFSRLLDGRIPAAFACFSLMILIAALGALPYLPVAIEGEWWTLGTGIDPWPIATTYIGLALAGAMFLAIGMFISSLVTSQMVAAIVSLFIGLFFIVGGIWQPEMDTSSTLYQVFYFFSVPQHFARDFARGLIDTRHLILYASVALYGIFLTVRSLESRRWQ